MSRLKVELEAVERNDGALVYMWIDILNGPAVFDEVFKFDTIDDAFDWCEAKWNVLPDDWPDPHLDDDESVYSVKVTV